MRNDPQAVSLPLFGLCGRPVQCVQNVLAEGGEETVSDLAGTAQPQLHRRHSHSYTDGTVTETAQPQIYRRHSHRYTDGTATVTGTAQPQLHRRHSHSYRRHSHSYTDGTQNVSVKPDPLLKMEGRIMVNSITLIFYIHKHVVYRYHPLRTGPSKYTTVGTRRTEDHG